MQEQQARLGGDGDLLPGRDAVPGVEDGLAAGAAAVGRRGQVEEEGPGRLGRDGCPAVFCRDRDVVGVIVFLWSASQPRMSTFSPAPRGLFFAWYPGQAKASTRISCLVWKEGREGYRGPDRLRLDGRVHISTHTHASHANAQSYVPPSLLRQRQK